MLLHYLAKQETRKIAFFTHCMGALSEFNQFLLDFFNFFYS